MILTGTPWRSIMEYTLSLIVGLTGIVISVALFAGTAMA